MTPFGKYEILDKLGSGATAEVFHARDLALERDVALKLLKPALVADADSFQRFLREASSAAGLFHPHIVTVLDMGETDGRYYIAMRYIDGPSLAHILVQQGPLPLAEVTRLAEQIGAALDYAHAQGFLHRDVKPANILRDSNGEYFLADFGLTKAMMSTGLTSHTGAVLGTPPYIPPEIWSGEKAAPASDQYALACVLYEALTGKVLFNGDTPPAVMTAHVLREPDLSALPAPIRAVLSRALTKSAAERFPNLAALSAALQETIGAEKENKQIEANGMADQQKDQQSARPTVEEQAHLDVKEMAQKAAESKVSPIAQKQTTVQPKTPIPTPASHPPRTKKTFWLWLAGGLITGCGLLIICNLLTGIVSDALLPQSIQTTTGAKAQGTQKVAAFVQTQPAHSTATIAKTPTPRTTPTPAITAAPSLGIGSTQVSPKDGMVMVYVPAGEFQMGSNDGQDDEKPVHIVDLDVYWIDQTEVTNAQYARCVADGGCKPLASSKSNTRDSYYGNAQFDDYPVIYVDWNQASAYCQWAGRRLPTEAEWEKAARGTDGRTYPWGNAVPNDQLLNYRNNSNDASAVGSYSDGASPYGALDMAGNVSEWVADWYGDYPSESVSNPKGPANGHYRMLRGGSWHGSEDDTRAANRTGDSIRAYNSYGFRCAISETEIAQNGNKGVVLRSTVKPNQLAAENVDICEPWDEASLYTFYGQKYKASDSYEMLFGTSFVIKNKSVIEGEWVMDYVGGIVYKGYSHVTLDCQWINSYLHCGSLDYLTGGTKRIKIHPNGIECIVFDDYISEQFQKAVLDYYK